MDAQTKGTPKLRIEFIGMAFALAIGQIGLEIGDFFYKDGGHSLLDFPYVLSHLILCIYIISSSWIGWQTSMSQGNLEALKDPFSISFVILLIDLFLVICYFSLVKSVENLLPVKEAGKEAMTKRAPESVYGVMWSLIIFGSYFVWDIFSKLIVEDPISHKAQVTAESQEKFLKRGLQSLGCFIITLILIRPMTSGKAPSQIVFTDVALFFTFVLFRGLKCFKLIGHEYKRTKTFQYGWYIFFPAIGLIATVILYYVIL